MALVAKTATEEALAVEIKSEFKKKDEISDKILQDTLICTICSDTCSDQKCFFDHLESHYLPRSPEHFQCTVCQESSKAQVDFYIHLRVHYKPSLMSELGSSITGIPAFLVRGRCVCVRTDVCIFFRPLSSGR